jgi:hypothetical protein
VNRLSADLVKLKKVIQPGERVDFCFVGDLYDPALPADIPRSCLQACVDARIPFQILTKSGIRAAKDFDLYRSDDLFGATLTGCDEWEPGAAPTEDRIAALQEAHDRNIKTWASFEPVIFTDKTLELIKRVHPFVDDIKIGKLNSKRHNPPEVKEREAANNWPKFYHDVADLCIGLGRIEGQTFTIKDDLKAAAKAAPAKEDRGFQKFKAGMKRRTCWACGYKSPHDLTPDDSSGERRYICASCHILMGTPTPPQPADSQTKLGGEVEA